MPGSADEAGAAEEESRPLLFSIAYGMTGSAGGAEDVVQDAFLGLTRARQAGTTITDPKAYLAAAVTRLGINYLSSARVRRETYVGDWLPEPIVVPAGGPGPAEHAELARALLGQRPQQLGDEQRIATPPLAPARAGRVRFSSRLLVRTRAPPSRGRAAWTAPARSSIRRSASTSGSAAPVTWPAPKPHCARRASGAAAAAPAAGRRPAGPASPRPSTRSPAWSPRACPIPRSASAFTYHTGPCRPTSRTCSPSWTSPPVPSSPPT